MTQTSTPLVEITPKSHDLLFELAYATPNNVTGAPIYQKAICFLHEEAAEALKKAIEVLIPLNLKLKVWDGFRPLQGQQALFNHTPDPNYVSHPQTGTRPHCRGIAIDLTIVDQFGHELPMGTHFDDFRALAHHGNDQVSEEAQRNRLLLAGVMSVAGFEPIQSEWWHYQLPNAAHFPIIEDHEIPSPMM